MLHDGGSTSHWETHVSDPNGGVAGADVTAIPDATPTVLLSTLKSSVTA